MVFNSLEFAVFFVIVFSLYLLCAHKYQNRLLLVANYVFYGAWDWRFLSLILISTIIDYFCGLKIHSSGSLKRRKVFLFISVFANLSILFFFKYFNFFTDNLVSLFAQFGFDLNINVMNILLPVGISFYTFQTMSYSFDIYRERLKPCKNFLDFALFVSFFPQLVAGPIERAENLLPQILNKRKVIWQNILEGAHLIVWGLFQKIFIADNLARLVDPVFADHTQYSGTVILLTVYAFTFQIFCDFAGYSNIARGLGKCMGFDLMVNFNLPYLATNPRDFWSRWHISLSTWLRDYLYIPLGGNRKGPVRTYINLTIVMLLGGLWHGAAWTFILWGLFHGILLVVYRLLEPVAKIIAPAKKSFADRVYFLLKVVIFFHLVCIGWLIFRSQSVSQFVEMMRMIVTDFNPGQESGVIGIARTMVFLLTGLLLVQLVQYLRKDLLAIYRTGTVLNSMIHSAMFYLMVFNSEPNHSFLYFQF